ncbi:MAG: sensor histidine kinase, partial [Phycisphaerales bacterium]
MNTPEVQDARQLQPEFCEGLLDYVPHDPRSDLRHVCSVWRRLCNADWAWLWLYNSISNTFELTACCTKEETDESERAILPSVRYAPGTTSIATYVCKTRAPIFVGRIVDWEEKLDGVTHRVTMGAYLSEMGCVGFDCVPLLMPPSDGKAHTLAAVGVVSLHWRELTPRVEHEPTILCNLGRASALAICNSQTTEQKAILMKLNRMTQRFLPQPSRRPERVRGLYLTALISLIQEHIHVGHVTILYRKSFARAVECIATTGLCDSKGGLLPKKKFIDVVYREYEGLTGCCFASGEPIVVQRPWEDKRYLQRYRSRRCVHPTQGADDPMALIPILPAADNDDQERACLGVIRCTEHITPMYRDELCHFNATELETLGFIAQQISPVLQTFDERIRREQSISVVRHDFGAPLGMIRDAIHAVIQAEKRHMPLGPHDLEDIEACSYMAINLAKELDPEPGMRRELEKQPTFLEGDIIARLRTMLRRYAHMMNNVEIHFENLRVIPKLLIDQSQVERAIYNALLNAIKYAKRGTTVEIRGRRDDSGFYVDISDHGIEVDSEDIPYMFEPGFRSAEAAQRAQGLGLG